MNRAEIYKAMELEKIIMYDEFRAKLDSLELDELEAAGSGFRNWIKSIKCKSTGRTGWQCSCGTLPH